MASSDCSRPLSRSERKRLARDIPGSRGFPIQISSTFFNPPTLFSLFRFPRPPSKNGRKRRTDSKTSIFAESVQTRDHERFRTRRAAVCRRNSSAGHSGDDFFGPGASGGGIVRGELRDRPARGSQVLYRRSPPDTRRPSCRREGQAGRTDGRRPSCGDVRAVEAMGLAGLLLYVSARAGDASGRASGAQVRRTFGSGGGRRKLLAPAGDFRRAASVGPQRGGFACRSRFAVEGPGAVPGDDRVSGADRPELLPRTRPGNPAKAYC